MRIPLFRIIDRIVGSILCVIFSVSRLFPAKKSLPRSILVIKLWAVGESVLTLPMIRWLNEKYPDARITVLCRDRNKAVYDGLYEVKLFEMQHWPSLLFEFSKYDLVIDCEPYLNCSALLGWWLGKNMIGFSHGMRSLLYTQKISYNDSQHVVQTYADMLQSLGIRAHPKKLEELSFSTQDEERARDVLNAAGAKKDDFLIGFCQSVAESGRWRKWPTERYSELADMLVERFKAKIVLVGGKDTIENNEIIRNACKHKESVINLGGKTSLKELFALVKKFKLFISNDTGPMHIAAAQGVLTVGLFGPNLPTRFAPFGKGNIALYEKTWCSPCINVHRGSFPECFNADKGLCMKQINVDMVFDACARSISKVLRVHKI